jgi:hypothetical protein
MGVCGPTHGAAVPPAQLLALLIDAMQKGRRPNRATQSQSCAALNQCSDHDDA